MELYERALRLVQGGTPLAMATVIRVSGSTPRHLGATMLVDTDANIFGTIGGGTVERDVTEAAARVAAGGAARLLRRDLIRDLAMCCGGSMEFYIEPVAPSTDAMVRALALWHARAPGRLVTPLDGAPKRVEELPEHGVRAPWLAEDNFYEPIWPRDRVVLFGSGHVARALGPVLARVDFLPVVCDDDETGALANSPEWAHRVVSSFELSDIERELGRLGVGDYVVIATRDHAIDQRLLEHLLANESLSYLGLIGSRGKIGRFRKRLAAKGIATEERWQRLHAPIGVDISAETPAEIAVSVAAELVRIRNRGRY